MAVRMRLRRMGRKKRPFYRVVVADARAPRDGRFIESIGYYNPMTDPAEIAFNEDRVFYWLSNGAQPTDTVKSLLSKQGLWLKWNLMKQKADPARIEEEFKKWQEAQELKRKKMELLKQQEEEKKKKEVEKKAEASKEEASSETTAQDKAENTNAQENKAPSEENTGEPEKGNES